MTTPRGETPQSPVIPASLCGRCLSWHGLSQEGGWSFSKVKGKSAIGCFFFAWPNPIQPRYVTAIRIQPTTDRLVSSYG